MKLHDLGEVSQKIGQAVVAGIKVIFVLHIFLLQLLMERSSAFLKAVIIILAAVEINGQASKGFLVSFSQIERTIVLPMLNSDGIAENRGQHLSQRSARAGRCVEFLRGFSDQRRALSADRRKHFWMREGETQRTIAAHRDSADGPVASAPLYAVFGFD